MYIYIYIYDAPLGANRHDDDGVAAAEGGSDDEEGGVGTFDHDVPGNSPHIHTAVYRGTSPIRKRRPLGPYSRTMPRALWKS